MIIIVGGFLAFAGGRFYRATFALIGCVGFAFVLMAILYFDVLPTDFPMWTVWYMWLFCLTITSGIGLVASYYARAGVLIVGAALGMLLGVGLFNSLIYTISTSNPTLGIYLTVLFCAIIVAILCLVFFDYTCILASSIIGAYMVMRGLSVFIGGYPNELVYFVTNGSSADTSLITTSSYAAFTINLVYVFYFLLYFGILGGALATQFILRKKFLDKYSYRQYDFKYRKK